MIHVCFTFLGFLCLFFLLPVPVQTLMMRNLTNIIIAVYHSQNAEGPPHQISLSHIQ